MFCPKCGTQVPSDANFCMSCGTDLSQYQQQSSGGGVNTGDVGMIKDSELESTESQQQASIEQSPTINIQLGEIIRESVSEAMKQGTAEQQEEFERVQETSVSVTPEAAKLLKKAKYATSDEEAEALYNQVLELDIENDLVWYGKFLMRSKSLKGKTWNLPCPQQALKTENGFDLVYEATDFLFDQRERYEEMRKHKDRLFIPFTDGLGMYCPMSWSVLKAMYQASSYFRNAVKGAPNHFSSCPNCGGKGYTDVDKPWGNRKTPVFWVKLVTLCQTCLGMGQVRAGE